MNHAVLTSSCRLVERTGRVRLRVGGADRARFLHNVTTQDVKRMVPGEGREAFVTSLQGKTLGYLTLLVADDHILLRTDQEGWPPVLPHLTRYSVFDEVTLDDVTEQTFEIHLAGCALEKAESAGELDVPGPNPLAHVRGARGGIALQVVRENLIGLPGLTFLGPRGRQHDFEAWIAARTGGTPDRVSAEEFERLRIQHGLPIAGRDVTPENLPQEVGRDAQAISFVKGCYLGQETVARIDALGHVNRHLRGLRIEGPPSKVPTPGALITTEGKTIGQLTSAAFAPALNAIVALGYVRSSHTGAGTAVQVGVGGDGDALPGVVADSPIG